MKRFKPEQRFDVAHRPEPVEGIVAILREVERAGDRQEVVRKHDILDQTYYRGSTLFTALS